ncbi:MAG: hypothetical protein QF380_06215 [Candidatus Marinimicrobia bacterium]|jgi:glycosyltransferase involved in cell wall biosynthesis|nr:hypothetical protein [Candidatus Neomarinimicrobiota bacterium]
MKKINKEVYLLLRTHNRPNEFKVCLDSIKTQTTKPKLIVISDDPNDIYVNNVRVKHDIFRVKRPFRRWWIRHHNPYNDYFNQAVNIIPDGNFVIYLDDDDLLLYKDWINLILNMNVDVLIGRFKMGKDHNYTLIGDEISRGKIGTSCFAIKSEIAKKFTWPKKSGGDYKFIKKIVKEFNPVFVNYIVGGVQKNLNQSWRK